MLVTEEIAKTKMCPSHKGFCVGSECMAFRKGYADTSETHEAREEGPWQLESDEDTIDLIRVICGDALANQVAEAGVDEDGTWAISNDLAAQIDEKLEAHYVANFESFKQEHTPDGDGWELADEFVDHDGMHVRWEKQGPLLYFCGLAGAARS